MSLFNGEFVNKNTVYIADLKSSTRNIRVHIADHLNAGDIVILDIGKIKGATRNELISFLEGKTYDNGHIERINENVLLLAPATVKIDSLDQQIKDNSGQEVNDE